MNRFLHDIMTAQFKLNQVSGVDMISFDNSVGCIMPEIKVYGKSVRSGVPSKDQPVELTSFEGNLKIKDLNLKVVSSLSIPLLRHIDKTGDVFDTNKGEIIKTVEEVIIDGVNVYATSVVTSGNYPYLSLTGGFTAATGDYGFYEILSTHFITQRATTPGSIYLMSGYPVITPWDTSLNTTSKVNSWFKSQFESGTPVKIIYPLKVPVTVAVENTDIIQPDGYGQICVSGNMDDIQIEAKYLIHT
ncbi:MAG: hypothetical protein E7635_07610 [Ruminococcaceae bacterium]|nr:hypothetical protein [Oscillospiraceae bacterium]